MGRNIVRGPGHSDIELPGTVADNAELSEFPRANLPPHSNVTTSSDNAVAIQACRSLTQQQLDESEGTLVPVEVSYDAGGSTLDSDVGHATMMRGETCSGTPFVVVNGMTVIPDENDETVDSDGLELTTSCTEDEWYHISQAVVAAASAASKLELEERAAAESQSVALATAMDSYIDWPEEDMDSE